jgi:lipopolysaccharide/colanic/teichoic acid biosynthesis glycosyltransferase
MHYDTKHNVLGVLVDDIYYIEHASFWFDLRVLLLTVRAVVSRQGAF